MDPNSKSPNPLEITGDAKPKAPVFTCIVYVRRNEDSTVSGRVANLARIETNGASERDVLGRLTREFKSQVLKTFEDGDEIKWIDPPAAKLDDEQVRSIPMHL